MKILEYINNKVILSLAVASVVTNGLLWWLLYSKFRNQAEFIPLHYNIYFGIDLYGPWYRILLMPLSGTGIFFINLVLSIIIYKQAKPMAYILMVITVLMELLLLWAGWLMRRELSI